MKRHLKYIFLIVFAVVASALIYEYFNSFKSVPVLSDELTDQVNTENEIFSNKNYTLDNPHIILDPYKVSPLTALVYFETNDLTTVKVTIKGKNLDPDITNTFQQARSHSLPIYGLYPDYNNTIIIEASNKRKVINIKTNPLPNDLKDGSVINKIDTDNLYFTTNNSYPCAYDMNGHIRWYLTKKYNKDMVKLNNGHILLGSEDLISKPNYNRALIEMDLLGKIYMEYNIQNGYSNSIYEMNNGNLLVGTNNLSSETVKDNIIEINRTTGEIVKTFDLSYIIPNNDGKDWLDISSISYDPKTNSLFVTGRNKNYLINIDYNSKELNYILADNLPKQYKKYALKGNITDYPNSPSKIILDGENVTILSKDKLTTYQINSETKEVQEINNINLNSNDNINMSNNKNINSNNMIKDDQGNNILKVNNLTSVNEFYPYDIDIYTPGQGQRLGSLGESKTIKDHMLLFTSKEDITKKYNLEFVKDPNKLTVKATFNKNDKAEVILDNVLDKKTYKIDTSKHITKKNGKVETETYITEDGISGKYYIYLKINGKNYKLYKYVIFND